MDSSGLPDHKAIRQTMYKQADVVVFCFSLAELKVKQVHIHNENKGGHHNSHNDHEEKTTSSTMSLGSIRNLWLPEVLEVIE